MQKMLRLLQLIISIISLLLLMTHLGYSRSIRDDMNLISDGPDSDSGLIKNLILSATITCEPIYGFLPCTTDIWGQLFMIVVYQYLLAQGEMYIASASNRFIQIHGPDSILGGSLFQLLPTFPQLFLVMASGLSASTEMAEQSAAMGLQLLAGAAVMMLTLVWGACVAFGSYDLRDVSDSSNSMPLNLFKDYGVKADMKSRMIARTILVSVIPLIILQLTKLMNSSYGIRVIILIALIVTVSSFILQVTYQVMEPWIMKWRFKFFLKKYVNDGVHKVIYEGMPLKGAILGTFDMGDKDNDNMLTKDELRTLLRELNLGEYDPFMGTDDYVEKIMRELDSNPDQKITKQEFDNAIFKWIKNSMKSDKQLEAESKSTTSLSTGSLVEEYLKALFELALGATIGVLLGTPFLQTVTSFSASANISQMWVPYVVIPLAMNFRMSLAFINMARQKTLMVSKVYGIVCLNNLVSLGTFLALVYTRDLTWDVSAEVLVVLIICTGMGLVGSFCDKFPFWTSFIAILLYPISMAMLYVFTVVLGWS